MKRLLTIFSVLILSSNTSLIVSGCGNKEAYFTDDNLGVINEDIETANKIMDETSKKIQDWWNNKTEININNYPNEISTFREFGTKLKTEEEITLFNKINEEDKTKKNVKIIKDYHFLNQIIDDFKGNLDNFNQELKNKYSNFYYDKDMPLLLNEDEIRVTLKPINFNNLSKMSNSNQKTEGIAFHFCITYLVKFKEITQDDQTKGAILVTDNLKVLNDLQNNIQNYLVTLIDNIFAKKNYQIIDTLNRDFNAINQSNTIWQVIKDELNVRKLNFDGDDSGIFNTFYDVNVPVWNFKKEEDSVLTWAGQGYDPKKFTPENFLQFYKKRYFENKIAVENNHYVKANITSFIPNDFTIENLPFKNNKSQINLKKQIKVLAPKADIDQQLNEFAQKVMKLWNTYKIETYSDKAAFTDKLVFTVNEENYTEILAKVAGHLKPNDSFLNNIMSVFDYISHKHDLKLKLNSKTNKGFMSWASGDDSNSLFLNLFWRPNNKYYPELSLIFGYKSFYYGFFLNPVPADYDKAEKVWLQIIEFKK